LEAALPDIGIDCAMLGTFKDSSIDCSRRLVGTTFVPERSLEVDTTIDPDGGSASTDSCGGAVVTLPAGADMVSAVSGTAGDDIACSASACMATDENTDGSASGARAASAALAGAAALAAVAF